jgi:diguanylate cyclase (GGDEF)-like protein/PAS domain S-box-containing protein
MLCDRLVKKIKILVVEDESIVAEDIKGVLEEFGYKVVGIADSGEKAIAKIAENKPHLVLMDIRLKGTMDGIQTAEQVWRNYQIPIVYLTANADVHTLQRAKATEPFGYIIKPFQEKELQTAVEIALKRYQTEKQTKDNEQWLNTLLSSLGDAVIATDANARVTLLNRTAEVLTGWKMSEAVGKKSTEIFKLIHSETRTKIKCPAQRALKSGIVVSIPEQTLLIAKNGTEIAIDDSAAPILEALGEIQGAVIVFRDVTERKRSQRYAQTHHALTRILAESHTIKAAVPQLLQTICVGLQWDVGEFWAIDRRANVLRHQMSWHLLSEEFSEFTKKAKELTFSPGVELPGKVWESDRVIWLSGLSEEINFYRRSLAKNAELHFAFGIPIRCESKTLGVMAFYSQKLHFLDEELLNLLSTTGSQIGQFIERKLAEAALRNSQKRLAWQAKHDPLTGLVNRREFERCLEASINSAKDEARQHSLCYLDLDRFKIVNDTCGHAAGDELLRQVTDLLKAQIRTTDLLARLGGDEFGLLLYNCPSHQALAIANALRQSVEEFRFVWSDKTFTIGVSIGLVMVNAEVSNLASAVNAADAACYVAKNLGRNRVHFYQAGDREVTQQHGQIQWVEKLTKALEQDRFCLYYQPIVPLHKSFACDTCSEHYEVLLRLNDETGNLISPGAFIPAAERYHLMPHLDRWVIRTLFTNQAKQYRESLRCWEHEGEGGLYSINLSGASIIDDKFIDFVLEAFATYQVPPQVICFEITETVAITNLSRARKFIEKLKNLGCYFALDDFGSGMSSFAYLKSLPVDYLKIDGGFIKDIIENPTNLALTEAINQIGHVMGLQTIAEFVENDEILAKIKALGIDYAQGYATGKPRPLFEVDVETRYIASLQSLAKPV